MILGFRPNTVCCVLCANALAGLGSQQGVSLTCTDGICHDICKSAGISPCQARRRVFCRFTMVLRNEVHLVVCYKCGSAENRSDPCGESSAVLEGGGKSISLGSLKYYLDCGQSRQVQLWLAPCRGVRSHLSSTFTRFCCLLARVLFT